MPPLDRLGRPLRDLRISVTDRCNFRCDYCMPAERYGENHTFLPRRDLLNFEEIRRITALCVSELGVEKVRLTGGEPLLRRDLPDLVSALAAIPGLSDLTLTTNGLLLARHAEALAQAGLHRITISLDSLDPAVFASMNGVDAALARTLEGLEAAERAGLQPIKLNCVVRRGVNEESIAALAQRFRGTGHVVRFIEFMDVGTLNDWERSEVLGEAEILQRLEAVAPMEAVTPGYQGEVARRYRYTDGSGEVGIIASVTRPFCGDCSRARITAEGRFVSCLFAAGGPSLKEVLRSGATDAELLAWLCDLWQQREDRYSEARHEGNGERRRLEMYQVGG